MKDPMINCRVGDVIERSIEGMWFSAVIEKYSASNQTVDVKYLDDGNVEKEVPISEIRKAKEKNPIPGNENIRNQQRSTLPRPLAGLVEDDYDVRNSIKPTVFVHETSSVDEAIILNGAENRLAAGGGLRALRYLKK
mmetsp:Transcript_23902/g.26165  ORF Transcript_23902/g.26165 Transcript_23902/m.26165 type:complete len:137 (+) Transcript_23902:53-463(+)